MEGTPENIDVSDIIRTIEGTEGIQNIHDLHIWSITSGLNALSCHAVVDDQLTISESENILREIEHEPLCPFNCTNDIRDIDIFWCSFH